MGEEGRVRPGPADLVADEVPDEGAAASEAQKARTGRTRVSSTIAAGAQANRNASGPKPVSTRSYPMAKTTKAMKTTTACGKNPARARIRSGRRRANRLVTSTGASGR